MVEQDAIKLHFPSGQTFHCTDCGKCCRTNWRVKVFQSEAETIKGLEVYKKLTKEGFQPLKVMDEEFELPRSEETGCSFLQDERCAIHAEAGPGAKPAVCRLYPFQLVGTPEGYNISLAFTCPAVISGLGPEASHYREELEQTVRDAPHFFPFDLEASPDVTIAGEHKIPWTSYLDLEAQLLKSMRSKDLITPLMTAAASAIGVAIQADPQGGTPLEAEQVHEVLAEIQQLTPFFSLNVIASIEEPENPLKRKLFGQLLMVPEGTHSNILDCALPAFEPHLECDQVTTSIVERFVRGQIQGKKLTVGPSLVTRLLILASSLQIFSYYLDAKNRASQTLHFSLDNVEACFDILDGEIPRLAEIVVPAFEVFEQKMMDFAKNLKKPTPHPDV